MFEGKTLLITGGTGSFGHTVLDRFLTTDIREVRVFSRDEEKQDAMRHRYQAQNPELAQKIKCSIRAHSSAYPRRTEDEAAGSPLYSATACRMGIVL